MSALIAIAVIVTVLAAILSRPPITKALLGLLQDRKELVLFAVFVLAEIAAVAMVLAVLGPRVGFFLVIASLALFVIWATKPPASRR